MNSTKGKDVVRRVALERDSEGRLVLVDGDGVRHVGVEPMRAFPLSDPTVWIALCDGEGREIATLASLSELDASVRVILEQELARREFLPVIQRIVDVELKSDPTEWKVDTDRGPTKFFVEGSDAVRRLDGECCLVIDMQGGRYLISDRKKLDAHSRKMLEHYL